MFTFFERLVNPYPPEPPTQPPRGLYAFCRYYTRGIEPYLALMAVLFAGALTAGRRLEAGLAAARVRCPRCDGELSGTWADRTLAAAACPHCDQGLIPGPVVELRAPARPS